MVNDYTYIYVVSVAYMYLGVSPKLVAVNTPVAGTYELAIDELYTTENYDELNMLAR